jgi:hypothetical protein
VIAALLVTLAASVVSIGPANADPYGYTGGSDPMRFPDGADHWYCFRAVPSGTDQGRINTAMANLDNQTDMYDVYTATCGISTDVAWEFVGWCQIPGVGGCAQGRASCELNAAWGICDRFGVLVDATLHYIMAIDWVNAHGGDVGFLFNVNLNYTVCHELGHTAGLRHVGVLNPSVRCMNSVWIAPTSTLEALNYAIYSDHHVAHINTYIP